MIAGTGSGCGKTTVTLAILRAMQRRGIPLAAFKCGPDYIDPMFHKAVLGIPSRNLDLFFINEREIRCQIVRNVPKNGLGVIEGVMGFYDGASGSRNGYACGACRPSERTVAVTRGDACRLSRFRRKYALRCDFERSFGWNVPVLPRYCAEIRTEGSGLPAACAGG